MTTNDGGQPPDRIWLQIGAGMDGYGINATWHSEPIGEPDLEEVEYVRSPMRCHHGHESPAGLWNCPVCTDPILDAVRKAQLVEEVRVDRMLSSIALATTGTAENTTETRCEAIAWLRGYIRRNSESIALQTQEADHA